jgi:peroxiredoxin Q/BCP
MPVQNKLDTGAKAPEFTLLSHDEHDISLGDFKGQWVVLYFYPKDDTPGCTIEACDFTSGLKAFEKLNAVILGVSPDSPASHRKFIAKHELEITLLADEDRKVMNAYGAFGLKMMYGKEVEGVIRSTFIIDPKGKIAHAWYGVKADGHADKVREKLAELAG